MENKIYDCLSIGMLQAPPLPGSYKHEGFGINEIIENVVNEAYILNECGFEAYILQNMGDMPLRQKSRPETIAFLTLVAKELKRTFRDTPLGILVNWDGVASLAVAEAAGADFVRVEHVYTGVEVTSTGLFAAQCCEIIEMKKRLNSKMPIFADVYEPHGVPLGAKNIGDAAWETIHEAFADGLFISGKNIAESIELVDCAKERVPGIKIFLGGGATAENVIQLLQHFDGVCVGSWIKNGSLRNPIDKEKARKFIENVEIGKSQRNNYSSQGFEKIIKNSQN
jgi:uncharacterized protein